MGATIKKYWNYIIIGTVGFLLVLLVIYFIYNHVNSRLEKTEPMEVSFESNEVMKVADSSINMTEFLLYASDVYQGYSLQEEDDWNRVVLDEFNNEITFEQQVKITICEQIRMTKLLNIEAVERGIILLEDEKELLYDNALEYFLSITSNGLSNEEMTAQLINRFFEENALAQKVYNKIIDDYWSSMEADNKSNMESTTETENDSIEEEYLSSEELYFIHEYSHIEEKYDKDYSYKHSIHWALLDLFSFQSFNK